MRLFSFNLDFVMMNPAQGKEGARNMKRNKILAMFSAIMLATAGCGQSGKQSEMASLKAQSCSEMQKTAVDPSTLTIDGTDSAKPGDPVQYTLSEDLSCTPNQDVSWKTVAGSKGEGHGSAYVASFKKPGEYVVVASVSDPSSSTPYQIAAKTIVSAGLAIKGPQIGMAELEHTFQLTIPSDVNIVGAQWNFGDGTNPVNGPGPIDHTYMTPGNYTVTVNVFASNGDDAVLTHNIQVLPATDGLECVLDLAISGPSETTVGIPVTMSAYLPLCVSFRVGSVRWNFGDNTAPDNNQTATHAYAAAGTYTITFDIFTRTDSVNPFLTLTRQILVNPRTGEEEPEEPGPVDPNLCTTVGQAREVIGDIYTEDLTCGINGKKVMSYRDRINLECRAQSTVNRWVEASLTKELLNEGDCQGQACELPPEAMAGVDNIALGILLINGKYYLPHGGSKTFYSSQSPAGACSAVGVVRNCNNGVLGGSTTNVYLMCNNGCEGVGPHGSTQTGVVVGETSVPKVCAYGETGIFDIFNVVVDKTCENGTVTTSASRTGGIKTAGECPTYSWGGTNNWSTCDADCGGKQSRIFECRDSEGIAVPVARCNQTAAPVEERVCDGNPDAVRRSESSSVTEDASSSVQCPANQIGTIVKTRSVTTTKTYACINHQVGLESENVVPGPWVEERYCKDVLAHRCSQDSLSNTAANGRYKWMLKCRSQVPAIDQFLTALEEYEVKGKKTTNLMLKNRVVYATFMLKNGKPWIAPKEEKASCSVPADAYVATVCLASCATPEQMILSQAEASGKLKYSSFLEAWENDFKFVATLASNSSMSSKSVQKTAVDQWVTELIDTNHEILEFTTKSGGNLRLTPNHPIVTDQGTMKFAEDFKAGENLVALGGVRDEIVSIRKFNYFGKVYNVFVKSNELHKNVVITNGYLNGTAYFQNDGAQHLNRRLFRGHLIKGVLE